MDVRSIVARCCALVVVGIGLGFAVPGAAQPAAGVVDMQPAAVLVLPFDVTANHASFLLVSRIGDAVTAHAVDTHWVFYAADCRHLADLSITLTDNDTIVVDPTRIQSQTQEFGVPVNEPHGPIVDLSGERGVATVTVQPAGGTSPAQIVGGWTIGDLGAGVAFGADGVGFATFALPDAAVLDGEGLVIPTYDPSALDTSQVIVVGLEQQGDSIVPIARAADALGGAHVCCNAAITDTLENRASVPDVCFACALFAPIAPTRLPSADPPVIPAASAPSSAGFLTLQACRTAGDDGTPAPIGRDVPQYLVAFHGQAVGPFGVVTSGKYALRPPI
jgi:hypothetical protein